MYRENVRVLYPAIAIAERVRELGRSITAHYEGKELVLVVILKGAATFAVDLARQIDLPVRMEYMGIRSYEEGGTESTGEVEITKDVKYPLGGKHVLLVEDIVDTGRTMDYLLANMASRRPASLKVASLLSKPSRREIEVHVDWVGFRIKNLFVIGSGLDFKGLYRNLPYVGVLDQHDE